MAVSNQITRPALTVFTVGLVAALLWTFVLFPRISAIDQWFDLNHFGAIGEHIYRGDGFSFGNGPTVRRAPLYPYLVAGAFKVFGLREGDRSSYNPVLLLQCVFAGVTCLAVFLTAKRLFGKRVALAAGLLCAFWPQCLRYVGAIDVECTMTMLISLITLAVVRLCQERSWINGALAGLAIGLATLAKPVPMLFPLVVLALLWRNRKPRPLTAVGVPFAACVGAMALVCLPWMVRNQIVTGGRFHAISSNAAGEFLRGYVNVRPEYVLLRTRFQGNWDYQANLYENQLLANAGFEWNAGPDSVDTDLAKDAVEGKIARERVIHEPLGFLRKFAVQLFTFWYLVETPAKCLFVGVFALLALALGAVGLRRAAREHIDAMPVAAVVLYFNVIYAAILAFARYSMPVFPTLLVLSAAGLCALIDARMRAARHLSSVDDPLDRRPEYARS